MTTMGNQLALTVPSLTKATGQDEEGDEVGVEEILTTFLGRWGGMRWLVITAAWTANKRSVFETYIIVKYDN
jgi:hypothetical protein